MIRTLTAFGVNAAIESDDERLFALLDRRLPTFPVAGDGAPPRVVYRLTRVGSNGLPAYVLVRGRRTIVTTPRLSRACDRLVADLQIAFGRFAHGWTFIHAGVVAVDGRAIVLPGRSGSGKSTLVAALLKAGADYGSDEVAVLDPEGRVHPYPRRLALRGPGRRVQRVPRCRFGASVMAASTPAAAIVFTEFEPGAVLDPRPISPGATVLRLLKHCLGARTRPADSLRMTGALARGAPAFAGFRSDAAETAERLLAHVRSGWDVMPPADHESAVG